MFSGYHIIKESGRGGMAVVYEAKEESTQETVAIKVLNKEYVHNENIRKRFLAEANNMMRMSHSNIIKVIRLLDEGDVVAFVMEYISGYTLKEYLDQHGKLSYPEIFDLFNQMLNALEYVHKLNLVHRDIKPSNFILDQSGRLLLLDFGIAKSLDAESSEYTQTGTGIQMGTLMYMSPEQITETKNVTAQSDLFSLGVVLWQMVMGRRPYDTGTISNFQLQVKIVNENLTETRSTWDKVISKLVQRNVDERVRDVRQVRQLLHKVNLDEQRLTDVSKDRSDSELTIIDSNSSRRKVGDDQTQIDSAGIQLSRKALSRKTLIEIKSMCSNYGVKTTGTKENLIESLVQRLELPNETTMEVAERLIEEHPDEFRSRKSVGKESLFRLRIVCEELMISSDGPKAQLVDRIVEVMKIKEEPKRVAIDRVVRKYPEILEYYHFIDYTNSHFREICDELNLDTSGSSEELINRIYDYLKGFVKVSKTKRQKVLNQKQTETPEIKVKQPQTSNNGACYIATMAYGDYEHPQVLELRRFRDEQLMTTFLGRQFVRFYYSTSPVLVKMLKNRIGINHSIKLLLDLFVAKLKKSR
jgi:serine/threonine protein kinase